MTIAKPVKVEQGSGAWCIIDANGKRRFYFGDMDIAYEIAYALNASAMTAKDRKTLDTYLKYGGDEALNRLGNFIQARTDVPRCGLYADIAIDLIKNQDSVIANLRDALNATKPEPIFKVGDFVRVRDDFNGENSAPAECAGKIGVLVNAAKSPFTHWVQFGEPIVCSKHWSFTDQYLIPWQPNRGEQVWIVFKDGQRLKVEWEETLTHNVFYKLCGEDSDGMPLRFIDHLEPVLE